MSKATVSGGGSDGLYTIVLYPDNSKIDEKIDYLEKEILKLEQEIEDKQLEVDDLDADLVQLRKDVDDAIHNLEIARDSLGDNATQYITDNISTINSAISALSSKADPLYGATQDFSVVTKNNTTTLGEDLAAKDSGGLISGKISALQAASDALVSQAESNSAEFTDGITQSLSASSTLQDVVTARKKTVSLEKNDLAQSISGLETDKAAGMWEMYDRTNALESAMSDLITEIRNIDPQWEQDLSSEIANVNTSIDELRTSISRGDDDLSDEIGNIKSAMDKLDKSIKIRDGEAKDELEAANAAVLELAKQSQAWRKAKYELQLFKAQKLSKEKKIPVLELAKLPEDEVSAWCTDLTEDLSGNVGIIEIDGQTEENRIIQPGYSGAAVYNQSRDGCLQSPYSLTVAGAFANWAMFPGWQKWKPTYKIGEITSLNKNANTCSVKIAKSYSNCQYFGIASHLPTYYKDSYDNVPVSYMTCNANAFDVGDDVVVKFTGQDKDSPVVVGFVDHPKRCIFTLDGYSFLYDQGVPTAPSTYTYFKKETTYDEVVQSGIFEHDFQVYAQADGYPELELNALPYSTIYQRVFVGQYYPGDGGVVSYTIHYNMSNVNPRVVTLYLNVTVVSASGATVVPRVDYRFTATGVDTRFSVTPVSENSATFDQVLSGESLFQLVDGDGLTEE